MSVLDTIRRFSRSTVTFRFRSSGVMGVDGRVATPAVTTTEARVCVQPVTGDDFANLPEGVYVDSAVSVWSADVEFFPGTRFAHRGDEFEVISVQRWDEFEGGWRGVAVKSDEDEEG